MACLEVTGNYGVGVRGPSHSPPALRSHGFQQQEAIIERCTLAGPAETASRRESLSLVPSPCLLLLHSCGLAVGEPGHCGIFPETDSCFIHCPQSSPH